jgi:hypothetical protein
VLHVPGCLPRRLGPGAKPYAVPQADAAAAFLRTHRGKVAAITVSIGGNDLTPCITSTDAVGCLGRALGSIKRNLTSLVHRLRVAAGASVPIIGLTYPDIVLGELLSSDPQRRQAARLSIPAFRSLFNPALRSAYEAEGGTFIDVTAATGAYIPLTRTTSLAGHGRVPVAVARVCRLTYFCAYGDIHPRTAGYALIARLVQAAVR